MYTTIAQALRETLADEMRKDKNVFILGEDVGVFGGGYQITKGLIDEFGAERVRDTPISEIAIIGTAIGAAITGMRPVAEIQFADFLACAMDQIVNQAAKLSLMSGGQVNVPIVIRAPEGATGRAAQHSQSIEAWFMHVPGLKVVVPSTPYDARGLLFTAMRDGNPVLFLEHKLLYGSASPGGKAKTVIDKMAQTMTPAPENEYTIPFGKADVKREGKDITVVATLYMVHKALSLAVELEKEGVSLEIIDPRTLVPLDKDTIIKSVRKTGRLLIVSEDHHTCGAGSEIAAIVADEAFEYLDAPIKRACSLDVPMPFSPGCEEYVLPNTERILRIIKDMKG